MGDVQSKNDYIIGLIDNTPRLDVSLLEDEIVEQALGRVDVSNLTKIATKGQNTLGLLAVLCFELWRQGRDRELYDLNARLIGRNLLMELSDIDQLPVVCAHLYQEFNVSMEKIDAMLWQIIETLYKSCKAIPLGAVLGDAADIENISMEKSTYMMNFAVRNLRYFSEKSL